MKDETKPTAQLSTRIDAETHRKFTAACTEAGRSQREVIEGLLDAYAARAEAAHVLHIDGSTCPLSEFLTALQKSVLATVEDEAREAGVRAIHELARTAPGGKPV